MTADFFPFDMAFLGRAATRIINEVHGRQPRGLRRDQQAAGDDRVGVGNFRWFLARWPKWIDDAQLAIDRHAVLHVFRPQRVAIGL